MLDRENVYLLRGSRDEEIRQDFIGAVGIRGLKFRAARQLN